MEMQGQMLPPITLKSAEVPHPECIICFEDTPAPRTCMYTCTTTNCKSMYCTSCVRKLISITQSRTCALCKTSSLLYPVQGNSRECIIRLSRGSSTYIAEGSSDTLPYIRETSWRTSLVCFLWMCPGVVIHVFMHVAMVLCLGACLHETTTEPTYIQSTTVLAVIYWISSCVHATITMIIMQCSCAQCYEQELVFGYGVFGIFIWFMRVVILCVTLSLGEQSDKAVLWFSVLLAVSVLAALFDAAFCLRRSITGVTTDR
jgi:hypothetical protein